MADIPDFGDEIVVAVEIPRGSRNKYEYDAELGVIVLDRRYERRVLVDLRNGL